MTLVGDFLLFSIGNATIPSESQQALPDINNIATACQHNNEDPICLSITKAIYDFKDFQNRSMEYMVKKANLGLYEKLTITGLSMLVNRKIEIKNKSFFSDKINQNLEIRESSAVFSFEYNF